MREHRSWRDVVRVTAGLTLLVIVVRADFCGDDGSGPPIEDPEDTVRIQVTLLNLDTENIHILVGSEDFMEGPPPAGNRLGPGASRVVEVGPFRVGDARSFSAGRQGTLFDTQSCSVTNASFTSKRAEVEWNGVELDCDGW